jgi:hypothetical protein
MWQQIPDGHFLFGTGNNRIVQFALVFFQRQLITAKQPIALHDAKSYDGADGQSIYELESSFHAAKVHIYYEPAPERILKIPNSNNSVIIIFFYGVQ